MASNVVNRTVNVYIQTGDAQKAYDKLIEKQKELQKQLRAYGDPANLQRLKEELDGLSAPIEKARAASKQASQELTDLAKKEKQLLSELKNAGNKPLTGDAEIAAIAKAKNLTDEYINSLIKLAAEKQKSEKGMSGFNLFSKVEGAAVMQQFGHEQGHTVLGGMWKDLDEGQKAVYNYAASFSKLGAEVKEFRSDMAKPVENSGTAAAIQAEIDEVNKLKVAKKQQQTEASQELDLLIKKQRDLKGEIAKAGDSTSAEKLKQQLAALEEPLNRAAKKVSGELAPSLRDTGGVAAKLRNELSRMSETDPGFAEKVSQLSLATREMDAQRGKLGLLSKAWKSFWDEAKTVAVGVIIGNTVQSAIQAVLGYVTGIVTGSAKISDSLADIQRVTGFTKDEVLQINRALSKIDTRTSVQGLRDIAVVAGKLGVAKDDIVGFVRATDKLSVALGDELGSVDQITTELGKILNVFDGKITEKNILHLGNAIVDLANKGVATGGFIVDFTQRMSGIAKASNLGLSSLVGFAAGLEETGQKVESSSTAMQKLVVTIAQDIPKAAKIAGAKSQEEIQQFADLFAKTPAEALLKFAQGLQKNKQSFAEIASGFKDSGEDGQRVISTLTVLGQKSDFFREKIQEAGIAMQETGQIENAFALKNNTLGAQIDKLKKSIAGVFASQSFKDLAQAGVSAVTSFVNVLKALPKFLSENKTGIGLLVTGILTMNSAYLAAAAATVKDTIAKIFNATVTKAAAFATNLATVAQGAYITITNVLIGRLSVARAAQMLWAGALSLGVGPIGAILVGVGVLVVAINTLTSSTKTLTAEQLIHADVSKRVSESTTETLTNVKILTSVIQDNTSSLDNRKKALNALIAISPDYLKGLTLENAKTAEGKQIIDQYVNSLLTKATAEAKHSVLLDKLKEKEDAFNKIRAGYIAAGQQITDKGIEDYARAAKKMGDSNKIAGLGTDNKLFGVNMADLSTTLDVIQLLNKDVTDLAKKDVTSILTGGVAGGTIEAEGKLEALRKKLKELQDLREKAISTTDTKDKSGKDVLGISSLNKQITATEKQISQLEGHAEKLSKAENKTLTDQKALREELIKMADSLLPEGDFAEKMAKELQESDTTFAQMRLKAHGNAKLLEQIDQLSYEARRKIRTKYRRLAEEDLKKDAEKELEFNAKFTNGLNNFLENGPKIFKLTPIIDRDQVAKAELDVLTKSGKERLDAEKKLLAAERDQKLDNENLTEKEKALIRETYRLKEADLDRQTLVDRLQLYLNFAKQSSDILSVLSSIKTDKENAELERDKKSNEKKKQNLSDRLKAGLISQQQYDREVQKIDDAQAKREKEVRLKQFKRDQRAQITQALMSGAESVVSTLAARPGSLDIISLGAFRAINIGLAIAATAAQVAKIASQKPPEFAWGGQYGYGGKTIGRPHSRGGNPIIDGYTGKKIGEIEEDEGIINKFSMRDQNKYHAYGTISQIGSALNARHGGTSWDTGATLRPGWKTAQPMPMNFAVIRQAQHFANGGVFGSSSSDASGSTEVLQSITTTLVYLTGAVSALNEQLSQGIRAKMYLTEQEEQQDRLSRIRQEATMKGG
jgi:TP901 family phage tail tape measure protein